jgi:microcystin-dependent protein
MNGVTIPNINNDVFIRGNVTSGFTGGANSVTLAETNLPAHTHVLNNAVVPAQSHTHNYAHAHQVAYQEFAGGSNNLIFTTNLNSGTAPWSSGGTGFVTAFTNAQRLSTVSNPELTAISNNVANRSYYTSAALTNAGAISTFTGTPTDTQTVSANTTGSGTAFNIIPVYITARWVMRVK